MDQELKQDIEKLCRKVMEVVHNNDWPTTEGEYREGHISPVESLVTKIREGIGKL